jgi:hypothetical protein
MVEQRELSDLITAIRSGLSSGKLHKGTAELRGFLKLLPQYEKRMIRERPQCFAEAKLLLHDLQNQGFAKNPVNSKRPFVLYPTLEDHEGRRPMLIFGGAFEMNRKRH